MSKALLMAIIGLLMISLMSIEVDGVPMIPSCPAIILYETTRRINQGFTEVKKQGATLNGTVNRIGGTVNQMHEDLAEVRGLLVSLKQPCAAVNSSNLCEY